MSAEAKRTRMGVILYMWQRESRRWSRIYQYESVWTCRVAPTVFIVAGKSRFRICF
jgi:hypothetical protein